MRAVVMSAMVLLSVAGCQNPQQQKPVAETPKVDPAKSDLLKTAYQNSADDLECGEKLHQIEGLLMMYATLRGQLPASLDQLVPLNGKKPLDLICPATKKPYIYAAKGLVAEGDPRMIVLYDAAPSHNGKRQAIVLMPGKDDKAAYLDIAMLTDEVFKAFHPAK